jgi:glycosyltransferase involved in cell wall biosynthesis
MRVLINGLPLFAKRLSEQLQKYDTTSSYIFLDTYNSRWAQLLFYLYLPFSDCVISMNGVTDNSGSLNLVLKRKKKLILQWMGTDALLAMDRFEKRTIDRKYIDYGYNFVDSMWLMEEVKSLGVAAEYMHFKSVNVVPNKHVYDKISVISYVAENRQTFYGMKQIAEIAKEFPEIEFNLYGLTYSEFPTTPNVHLQGWVTPEKFQEHLKITPIFLRLTDHDGFSVSVIEALGFGCEVIWSLPSDFTHLAKNTTEAIEKMQFLISKIEKGGMKPNQELITIVKSTYNPETLSKNYIQKLKEIVSK